MITQFDAYVVTTQTGRTGYTTEVRAREVAERAYPAGQKVELVTVTGTNGQNHSAWIHRPRRGQQ